MGAATPFTPDLATHARSVRGRDWQTILLIGVAHAGSHFFQLVLPSLYIALGAEFGYDFARLGLLVSAFYIVSGLGQASSGFLVDRIGARPVLWFGQGCFVAAALCIGAANGYTMLMVGALIGGVGNSVFHPVDFSLLNKRISPKRLGHAFSAHGLTGSLGWALAPVFIATITAAYTWRIAAFSAAGLLAVVLLMTILGRRLISDTPPADLTQLDAPVAATTAPNSAAETTAPPVTRKPSTLLTLLSNPALWCAFLFFAFTSLALAAVQSYSIPLLRDLYGLAPMAASGALSGYMLASAGGMLVGGFLVSSQPHTERIVLVALILAGATLAWLATGGAPSYFAAAIVALAGFCAGVAGPSRDMLIRRVTPKGSLGSVYGLVYSGMDTGAAVAPLAFGVLVDMGLTGGPWFGAGAAFVVGAILAQSIARFARRSGV